MSPSKQREFHLKSFSSTTNIWKDNCVARLVHTSLTPIPWPSRRDPGKLNFPLVSFTRARPIKRPIRTQTIVRVDTSPDELATWRNLQVTGTMPDREVVSSLGAEKTSRCAAKASLAIQIARTKGIDAGGDWLTRARGIDSCNSRRPEGRNRFSEISQSS